MMIQYNNRYHCEDRKFLLSQYPPKEFAIILVNYLVNKERKFVPVKEYFREQKFHRSLLRAGCSMKLEKKGPFMGKGIIKKEKLQV